MSHSSKCDQNHNFSKNEQATSGVLLKQESVNYFLQIFNSAAQQYKNKVCADFLYPLYVHKIQIFYSLLDKRKMNWREARWLVANLNCCSFNCYLFLLILFVYLLFSLIYNITHFGWFIRHLEYFLLTNTLLGIHILHTQLIPCNISTRLRAEWCRLFPKWITRVHWWSN